MNRRRFFGLLAAAPVGMKATTCVAPLVASINGAPALLGPQYKRAMNYSDHRVSLRHVSSYDVSQDRMISRVESRVGPGGRVDLLPRFAMMYTEFSCKVVG